MTDIKWKRPVNNDGGIKENKRKTTPMIILFVSKTRSIQWFDKIAYPGSNTYLMNCLWPSLRNHFPALEFIADHQSLQPVENSDEPENQVATRYENLHEYNSIREHRPPLWHSKCQTGWKIRKNVRPDQVNQSAYNMPVATVHFTTNSPILKVQIDSCPYYFSARPNRGHG